VQELTVGAGEDITQDFALMLRAASLKVRLYSSTYADMPLAGVDVRLAGVDRGPSQDIDVTSQTGLDGVVDFSDLVPGTYEVSTPSPAL
jgi:hypothetical protein